MLDQGFRIGLGLVLGLEACGIDLGLGLQGLVSFRSLVVIITESVLCWYAAIGYGAHGCTLRRPQLIPTWSNDRSPATGPADNLVSDVF